MYAIETTVDIPDVAFLLRSILPFNFHALYWKVFASVPAFHKKDLGCCMIFAFVDTQGQPEPVIFRGFPDNVVKGAQR